MKKSLLAIALLGAFAGAANAQSATAPSSVTLFGIADVGVQYNDPKRSNSDKTWGLSSGNQSGTRWGVRGTEDLGSGLKANFWLEGGYNIDTGTTAQSTPNGTVRLFGRQAYAGLSGNFGEVRLGRQMASGFDLFSIIDVYGTSFVDAGLQSTFASVNALRLDNTILYKTPNLGGFVGQIGYSFNPGLTEPAGAPNTVAGLSGNEQPKTGNNARTWTAGGTFITGPLAIVATYERIACPGNVGLTLSSTCNATTKDAQWDAQLGATYDFKVVKLHLAYAKEKNQFAAYSFNQAAFNGATSLASNDSQSYAIGATVPLAGGNLLAQYQNRNDKSALNGDISEYSVGYTYPLSRRTNLWTYYSDKNSKNALDGNSSTTGIFDSIDRRQIAFGVRHLF